MTEASANIGNSSRKEKLTIDQQVEHMRDYKGIQFNIVNEDEAKLFLRKSNYYFKIKAFAKNYEQYRKGPNQGKYINLEFAYLQELSTLDMHLRNIIMRMTTDVEHYLKTQMLAHFSENSNENGYAIVDEFFAKYPRIKEDISKKCTKSACSDLVVKYYDNWALWNIVEVISFGDFISLFQLYDQKYSFMPELMNCLWPVRFLRNAAAHNNCLINSLKSPYFTIECPKNPCERLTNTGKRCERTFAKTKVVDSFLSLHLSSATNRLISKDVKNKMMINPVIHDFVTLIYVYQIVCSPTASVRMMKDLKMLFDGRIVEKREYFEKNQVLLSHYRFVKIVVDYFYDYAIMKASNKKR